MHRFNVEEDPKGKELMNDHPNSILIHQCLLAANAGDRQTLRALFAEDVVWRVKGASPWQGELKGADEIFDYLADLGEVGNMGFRTDIEDVMVSSHRASVLCRAIASRGEQALDARFLLIAEIVDRRVQDVTTVQIDVDRFAAFWAQAASASKPRGLTLERQAPTR